MPETTPILGPHTGHVRITHYPWLLNALDRNDDAEIDEAWRRPEPEIVRADQITGVRLWTAHKGRRIVCVDLVHKPRLLCLAEDFGL